MAGSVSCGLARCCALCRLRRGTLWFGRNGVSWMVSRGLVRFCLASFGKARDGRRGLERCGMLRMGKERFGLAGLVVARLGRAWQEGFG